MHTSLASSLRRDVIEQEEETKLTSKMLLLCGLPGSGKSTFCEKANSLISAREIVRVSQDDLGNRKECEKLVNEHIVVKNNKMIIIDRCNFDEKQRATWINMALAHSVPVALLFLDVSRKTCIDRARKRENHPTVPPKDAERVIGFIKMTPPSLNEKLDEIYLIKENANIEENKAAMEKVISWMNT